jgi:hypothetical protein
MNDRTIFSFKVLNEILFKSKKRKTKSKENTKETVPALTIEIVAHLLLSPITKSFKSYVF